MQLRRKNNFNVTLSNYHITFIGRMTLIILIIMSRDKCWIPAVHLQFRNILTIAIMFASKNMCLNPNVLITSVSHI